MNLKQIKGKIDTMQKNKALLESKRDAAVKLLEDKIAATKNEWNEKISKAQSEIDKYTKNMREQEKIEEMMRKAQQAADELDKKEEKANSSEPISFE